MYIIKDWMGNRKFSDKEFKTFQHGWDFLHYQFPVIYNDDGTQDDRDEILGEFYVLPKDN